MSEMEKLVDRLSTDAVIFTQVIMEDDRPVLYISYKSQPEKKVVCKTKEGAEELGRKLMLRLKATCTLVFVARYTQAPQKCGAS